MYLIRTSSHTIMLECGLIQGNRDAERHNLDSFPVSISEIDAVVLSHAHIDHSGRVPLLVKRGYEGPIYTQRATQALCAIMLPDSGYLNEKSAEWENKRRKSDQPRSKPLYTRREAEECMRLFRGIGYEESVEIVPGLTLVLHDAGHILGSSIVELVYKDQNQLRRLVFSGDLGYRDAPVMNRPKKMQEANLVLMESTYGDRPHRAFSETIAELDGVFQSARAAHGNILIPAFTVGRTQDLLYLMAEHYNQWQLADWQVYLDSPMGIEATNTYARYRHLYGTRLFGPDSHLLRLPNFHATRSTQESMTINQIKSGAIIIAGSGMCSGGRIHHHLKNNISHPECHLVIVGYQANGTLGRRLVDGAKTIKLWGEKHAVRAQLHTIGGLSAHADQADLIEWYSEFRQRPPLFLVHGESRAQKALVMKIKRQLGAEVHIAQHQQVVDI